MKLIIIILLIGIANNCVSQQSDSISKELNQEILEFKLFDNNYMPLIASKRDLIDKFKETPKVHCIKTKTKIFFKKKIVVYSFHDSQIQYLKTDSSCLFLSALFTDSTIKICYQSLCLDNNSSISDVIRFFPTSEQRKFEYPLSFIASPTLFSANIDESKMTDCLPFLIDINFILRLFFLDDRLISIDLVEQ